jgi:hypothetical protein
MDENDAVARRRRFFLGVVSTNPSLSMTLEPARHPTMLPRARVSDSSSCLAPWAASTAVPRNKGRVSASPV